MQQFGSSLFNASDQTGQGVRLTAIRRQVLPASTPARLTAIRRQVLPASTPARLTAIRRQALLTASRETSARMFGNQTHFFSSAS